MGRCPASDDFFCSPSRLLLVGCTATDPAPDPSPTGGDGPDVAATTLAAGLAKKDLTAVEFVGATGAEVDKLFQPLVTGMGPHRPEVTVGPRDSARPVRHGQPVL